LEQIPEDIKRHPSIAKQNRLLKKNLSSLILDRSYHHAAMLSLRDGDRRGRPDIVHFCLLEALGTPLNRELMLRVYVHTFDDKVISIAPETRLPRNCDRFKGLIGQLYRARRVPLEGKALLEMQPGTIYDLLRRVRHSVVLALSVLGKESTPAKVIEPLIHLDNPVLIVGGFPRGHFSESVTKLSDAIVSIDPEGLDAWIVVSRLLYEFESQSLLPVKRWNHIRKRQ